MRGEPLKPRVLALRLIPDVAADLAAALQLGEAQRCLALLTCDSDDCLYAALDQGTKAAEVQVVYAKSFYAGAKHASGPHSGEIIGMLAAADMETLVEGVGATLRYLRDEAWFFAADRRSELAYFPHVISATGSYLSEQAGVAPGEPLAYLIAPPLEALWGLDAALKVAEVRLARFYPPPSETNFAGALLSGPLEACRAAAAAFEQRIWEVAERPLDLDFRGSVAELLGPAPQEKLLGEGPYRLFGSGLALPEKPAGYTHLFDDRSLVRKDHPLMVLRGKLDLLQAEVLQAQHLGLAAGRSDLAQALGDVLDFLRRLLGAEVMGQTCPSLQVAGFSADELQRISHNSARLLGVGFVMPAASMGPLVLQLNRLRAQSRELELSAQQALDPGASHLSPEFCLAAQHQLNRLSSALHVLTVREIALAG